MAQIDFYQKHLERVSRSFAFCIPLLRGDLRSQVSLAYLLFRIVDTIEDSTWPSEASQQTAFQELISFFQTQSELSDIQDWVQKFPAGLPQEEKLLLDDTGILLEDFHALPFDIRQMMKQSLIDMIQGMMHFANKSHQGLKTMMELNQYCFFVAGLVGELLTGLVFRRPLSSTQDASLLLRSHHFGLFLQKINILKDQSKDEREGRFFVPERKQILQSLKNHCDQAFSYITGLPAENRDYKLFCAFSFFLALFSLPFIENSWVAKVVDKIPRATTEKYMAQIEKSIDDNESLRELYLKLSKHLTSLVRVDKGAVREIPWLAQSYHRTLSTDHLQSLGLI